MSRDVFQIANRVVAVTGGLGQLGHQFAAELHRRGAKVAVLDIDMSAERIAARYSGAANEDGWMFVETDVTSKDSLRAALAAIEAKWETPFGLVNNAALDSPPSAPASETGPFEDYPEASWDKVMEVNAKGVFLACQVFGGAMAAAGRGSIANIGSIYGVVSPDQSIYEFRRRNGETFYKPVAYSASKSALYNLTRYLATYWGPKRVRVNILTFAGVFNNQPTEFLEGYHRKVPMGRMARADEFNGAVVFLMSDASSYMTGAEMTLDGGFTAW
ncbi:SDR family oxidoreductase [Magnetospirillum fulvum]|uniref:NAD(P)-dependent dehydrogenase, short-chain alcohol dehydrogenase family n=1 Tax=Magnetospirillum fulvum TaxID=1082 RepID=A0A1H6H327_MAGFU|nr:SDR family oxidoreductase [Magnetospirillum fulvum]SEH30079.1 NAD(P)-dependent dehydrogenase, short-chain alcohol dehydrogenase family [Magnetospirillum fulvum]